MNDEETYVIATGTKRSRKVFGKRCAACPIVLDMGTFMGVTLVYGDDQYLETCGSSTKKILTSYRGMKIAELLDEFDASTLESCWLAGHENVDPYHNQQIEYIEKMIGTSTRKKILGMVPENIDKILQEMLARQNGSVLDVAEIDDAVKRGMIKSTPIVREYVDAYRKELDLLYRESCGNVITSDEARRNIDKIPLIADVTLRFLEAFENNTDRTRETAIYYGDPESVEILLIAKDKRDKKVEVTFWGGILKNEWPSVHIPSLSICLQYMGNDIAFKTPVPQTEHFFPLIARECGIIRPEPYFSLLDQEYGAVVYPTGELSDPAIEFIFNDRRLTDAARRIEASLEASRLSSDIE